MGERVPGDVERLVTSFLPQPRNCQYRWRLLNHHETFRDTPLMHAVFRKSLAMTRLLVDAGADPSLRRVTDQYRHDNRTALDVARSQCGEKSEMYAYLESITEIDEHERWRLAMVKSVEEEFENRRSSVRINLIQRY